MCTNLCLPLQTELHQARISARTMDFGSIEYLHDAISVDIFPHVLAFPRGHSFPISHNKVLAGIEELTHLVPENPLVWENQYGFVAVDIGPSLWGKIELPLDAIVPIMGDGMNEHGLSAASLWLQGAEYQPEGESNNLLFLDVMAWALGTCKTVGEVKEKLKGINVVSPSKLVAGYPAHFVFIDPNPDIKPLIVEYVGGEMKTYEADNGVITNEPPYPEQLANLAKPEYAAMTVFDRPDGNPGLLNLPDDSSPESRFVRATKLASTTYQAKTIDEAVGTAWQVIQNLQVPWGTNVKPDAPNKGELTDMTQWTVVRNHAARHYYYKSAFNQNAQRIDLTKLTWEGDAVRRINLDDGPTYLDVTAQLQGPSQAPSVASPSEVGHLKERKGCLGKLFG